MSAVKSPQEKKKLSLDRDCRNTYGENAKASRKSIPKSKQRSHQALRRASKAPLARVRGNVPEDVAIQAELDSRVRVVAMQREAWTKSPDMPLGAVLKKKAKGRSKVVAKRPLK